MVAPHEGLHLAFHVGIHTGDFGVFTMSDEIVGVAALPSSA